MGFRLVRFANLAAGLRSAGVEIAQSHVAKIAGLAGPEQQLFYRQLGFTIAVGGVGAIGFQNRHILRLAIHRRRGVDYYRNS